MIITSIRGLIHGPKEVTVTFGVHSTSTAHRAADHTVDGVSRNGVTMRARDQAIQCFRAVVVLVGARTQLAVSGQAKQKSNAGKAGGGTMRVESL
jgi:hypothetical protein